MSCFNNVHFSRNHFTPHYTTPYEIERVTVEIKEIGVTATIYPIKSVTEVPYNLISFLAQEYNDEIARGDTLPFFDPLSIEEFKNYWFGQFAAVMCIGEDSELGEDITVSDWAKRCIGTFYIKSAYPGRCSHICTSNFLVNAGIRRRGVGFYLCECFLRWAPILGYSRSIIELVFETNIGGRRLLQKCEFKIVGKVNSCAILKSTKDLMINSFIFTKELMIMSNKPPASKYDQIMMYITTGKYPPDLSKADKGRIRAASYNYQVIGDKLYLKGKEVITDEVEQFRLTTKVHEENHLGINRTTSAVSQRYYWSRIKNTVTKVISQCPKCNSKENRVLSKKRKNSEIHHTADVNENHSYLMSFPSSQNIQGAPDTPDTVLERSEKEMIRLMRMDSSNLSKSQEGDGRHMDYSFFGLKNSQDANQPDQSLNNVNASLKFPQSLLNPQPNARNPYYSNNSSSSQIFNLENFDFMDGNYNEEEDEDYDEDEAEAEEDGDDEDEDEYDEEEEEGRGGGEEEHDVVAEVEKGEAGSLQVENNHGKGQTRFKEGEYSKNIQFVDTDYMNQGYRDTGTTGTTDTVGIDTGTSIDSFNPQT